MIGWKRSLQRLLRRPDGRLGRARSRPAGRRPSRTRGRCRSARPRAPSSSAAASVERARADRRRACASTAFIACGRSRTIVATAPRRSHLDGHRRDPTCDRLVKLGSQLDDDARTETPDRPLHRAGAGALDGMGSRGVPALARLRRRAADRRRDRADGPARRLGRRRTPTTCSTASTASCWPAARTSTRPPTADARHPKTTNTRPDRDRAEIALALRALERDLPVLGICRGMQLINVALGGTLVQHLPDDVGHTDHRRALGSFDNADHDVRLAPGSLAARACGEIASRDQVPPPPGGRRAGRGRRGVGLERARRPRRGDRAARTRAGRWASSGTRRSTRARASCASFAAEAARAPAHA